MAVKEKENETIEEAKKKRTMDFNLLELEKQNKEGFISGRTRD